MPGPNGKYTYYPGCSAKGSATAYEMSMLAVGEVLGMNFEEIDDWNCCGATEYFSINAIPAYSLVARNLALAKQMESDQVVASCSACFLNLSKTNTWKSRSDTSPMTLSGSSCRAARATSTPSSPTFWAIRDRPC